MRGIILLIIALIIAIILIPISFVFALFFSGRSAFLMRVAISIDQLGNVVGSRLFNIALIKKGGPQFGSEDETISSVLGRNKKIGMLKPLGRWLDSILDKIEKDHTIKSIEN